MFGGYGWGESGGIIEIDYHTIIDCAVFILEDICLHIPDELVSKYLRPLSCPEYELCHVAHLNKVWQTNVYINIYEYLYVTPLGKTMTITIASRIVYYSSSNFVSFDRIFANT